MAEASGFYFRRDLTPVFDHLKLKSTAEDLAKKAVSQGLTKLIAQIDLPMAKLKNVSWTSFQAGKAKERGALKFDLELNLAAGWTSCRS